MINNKKILVADSDPQVLQELDGQLRAGGYQTDLARNGNAALAVFETFKPALCIINPRLTDVDGWLVCRHVVQTAPGTPIILLSSRIKDEKVLNEVRTKYGVSAFMGKPYNQGILLQTVSSLLQKAPPAPAQTAARPAVKSPDALLDDLGAAAKPTRRKSPARKATSDDLDKLLENTLSGIDLPSLKKKKPLLPVAGKSSNQTASVSPLDQQGKTVRVDTEDLRREIDKVRQAKEAALLEEQAVSGPLSSEDIFGDLIEEIETTGVSGESTQPPRAPKPPTVPVTSDPFADMDVDSLTDVGGVTVETVQNSNSNEYQLLSRIAAGGMAEVWKGKLVGEKGFEKIVAIKKILPHLSDNEEFITMFIDEAKVAANLTHPNIAQIYELGKMGHSFFIAMEYVSGLNLRTILSKCATLGVTLTPEVVAFVGMKLCSALYYAHNKVGYDNEPLHIVHRDVSPQNILISNEGEIKLVDFGIAKASIKATQTIAGSLKGKLLYMSPEQADGKSIDQRSDIFSLAVVLYECLTATKLFSGDSELSILKNVRQAKFVSPRSINPKIPERLDAILMRALSANPRDRYASAKQLEREFKDYLRQEKLHLNEGDVAAYVKLIMDENLGQLKAFETGRAKPQIKQRIIMPDTGEIQTFENRPSVSAEMPPAKSNAKKVVLWAVIAVITLGLIVFGVLQFAPSTVENDDTGRSEPPPISQAVETTDDTGDVPTDDQSLEPAGTEPAVDGQAVDEEDSIAEEGQAAGVEEGRGEQADPEMLEMQRKLEQRRKEIEALKKKKEQEKKD